MLMARDTARDEAQKLHRKWLKHQAFMAELARNKEWLAKIEQVSRGDQGDDGEEGRGGRKRGGVGGVRGGRMGRSNGQSKWSGSMLRRALTVGVVAVKSKGQNNSNNHFLKSGGRCHRSDANLAVLSRRDPG